MLRATCELWRPCWSSTADFDLARPRSAEQSTDTGRFRRPGPLTATPTGRALVGTEGRRLDGRQAIARVLRCIFPPVGGLWVDASCPRIGSCCNLNSDNELRAGRVQSLRGRSALVPVLWCRDEDPRLYRRLRCCQGDLQERLREFRRQYLILISLKCPPSATPRAKTPHR